MPTESKPTKRFKDPTLSAVRGIVKARRWNVTATVKNLNVADKYNFIVFRNDGATDIQLNFNADSDYWTLKAGAQSPVIQLNDSTVINVKTASGTSTLEAFQWG